MSLHHAAQHLKAQGRGPDDQLIHMSSKEIAGLQALAKAHGGSLTVNPQTGLPEAGFLDSILPTIVGAGIMAFAPELSPWMVGAGVGGLEALRTGDLGKGLKAGMGAYGGAGLTSAAADAGMLTEATPQAVNTQVAPALTAAPTDAGSALGANARDDLLARQSNMIGADFEQMPANIPQSNLMTTPTAQPAPSVGDLILQNKSYAAAAAGPALMDAMQPERTMPQGREQMIRPYTFEYNKQKVENPVGTAYAPGQDTSERRWFQPQYTALTPYKAAGGGLMDLNAIHAAGGGPIERMSEANAIGANTGYPQANINQGAYATPWQTPISRNVVTDAADTGVNQVTGEQNRFAAGGGISTLGGYSDGGRLLKGPGDGMSDNIPAQIGAKQPARLADGEFVVPADVVSHLGNGSTDAGAKQLYKMMDRIRTQRTGKKKQAPEVNPAKAMPA